MKRYTLEEEEAEEKKDKKADVADKKWRLASKMTTKEKKGGPGFLKKQGKEPHPSKNG